MKKFFDLFSKMLLVLALAVGFNACTAEDEPALSNDASITAFAIKGLTTATVVINGTDIAVTVPFGTNVAALEPEITAAANATVNPKVTGPMNFTAPVSFIVTAQDGKTKKTYKATVTVAPPTDGSIVKFTVNGKDGAISGTNISFEVYDDLPVTAIVPTIELTAGSTVSPASGVAKDFTTPVTYTVTFGTKTKVYTVSVVKVQRGFKTSKSLFELTAQSGTMPAFFSTASGQRGLAMTATHIFVSDNNLGKIFKAPIAGAGAGAFSETDTLITKDVVVKGKATWALSQLRTSGNTLVAANMVNPVAVENGWKLYKWTDVNAAPVKILDYVPSADIPAGEWPRFERFEIEGDVNGTGAILAMEFANKVQNTVRLWRFPITAGVVSTTPEIIVLKDAANPFIVAGNYSNTIRIAGTDYYLTNGAQMTPSIFSAAGANKGERLAMAATDAIGQRTVGTSFFRFKDANYMATMLCEDGGNKRQMLQIFKLKGEDIVEGLKGITKEDTEGAADPAKTKVLEVLLGDATSTVGGKTVSNGNIAGTTSIIVEADRVLVTGHAANFGVVLYELK